MIFQDLENMVFRAVVETLEEGVICSKSTLNTVERWCHFAPV